MTNDFFYGTIQNMSILEVLSDENIGKKLSMAKDFALGRLSTPEAKRMAQHEAQEVEFADDEREKQIREKCASKITKNEYDFLVLRNGQRKKKDPLLKRIKDCAEDICYEYEDGIFVAGCGLGIAGAVAGAVAFAIHVGNVTASNIVTDMNELCKKTVKTEQVWECVDYGREMQREMYKAYTAVVDSANAKAKAEKSGKVFSNVIDEKKFVNELQGELVKKFDPTRAQYDKEMEQYK